MAKQVIDIGTAALKGKDGHNNRKANTINNENFNEVYTALGADPEGNLPPSLPIAKGGTGATTLEAAKQNLEIDQVDNTPDAQKPISEATQLALNDKVNKADVITVAKGGTGATDEATARSNLGLGTAATKNVGSAIGQVMEVGNFGVGKDIEKIGIIESDLDNARTQLGAWYETWNVIHFKNVDYENLNKPNWSQLLIGRNGSRDILMRSSYNGYVVTTQLYGEHSVVPVTNGGTGANNAASARDNLGITGELNKYMPKAGGVFTGIIDTKPSTVVGGISNINHAIGPLRIPPTSMLTDGSFAPWITSSTVSGMGYLQHLAIGAVRGTGTWTGSGVFIAVGDNDNFATEDFRFMHGGIIEYRRNSGSSAFARFLSTINTTVDANGFIKAASPIVELYADKIKLNDEAKEQNIIFEKLGIGNYLIKNSSGLSNNGWYIEQPKDSNGNIFHAVEYGMYDNGDIWIKTYEQIMDGTRIVADPTKPIDIKEDRFISIRLNELPEDTAAPQNPTIVDSEGNPAPSRLHELEEGVWVISDENAAILEQERLSAMPALKRRQFRLTLAMNGYDLKEIEALIDQIEDPMQRTITQIEWQDATDFERTNPTLLKMAELMQLTTAQVDQLWAFGLSL